MKLKKQLKIALLAVIFGYALMPINSVIAAAKTRSFDTIEFWDEAVRLFDKAGYGENTDFGKHARSNLQRVQTLRGAKPGVLGGLFRGKKSRGAEPEVKKEEKKAEKKTEKKEKKGKSTKDKKKKTKKPVEKKSKKKK